MAISKHGYAEGYIDESGKIVIEPPSSHAGDYLLLRAEMDLIVGVTACSAELSNNGTFKPIDVELHSAHPAESQSQNDVADRPSA